MSEPIKIIVTAETAAAAQALRDFTKSTGSGLAEVEKAAHGAASGLNANRMALMEMGHSARSIADGLAAGMSPLRLAMMEAPRLGQAMGEASAALQARIIGLLPMLAGVSMAVIAGATLWHQYGDSIMDPTKRARELADALQKIPDLLKQIQTAQLAGAISPDQARKYQDMLSGKTPLYNKNTEDDGFGGHATTFRPEGTLGAIGGTAVPNLTTNAFTEVPGETIYSQSQWGDTDAQTVPARKVPNQEANAADRQKYVEYLMRKDGVTDANDQTKAADQAMVELQDNEKKLQIEAEQGIQKEIDRIKLRTEMTQRQIDLERQTVIGAGGSKSQADAAAKTATDSNNLLASQDIAALQQDAAEKAAQAQADAEKKIRDAAAEDAKTQIERLETQISVNELSESQKRSQQYLVEYTDCVALYTKLLLEGEMSEDEYNNKVVEATKKAKEAQQQYNEELQREADLRRSIARGQAQGQLEKIRANPFLTDQQKTQQSIGPIQDQMAANQDELGSLHNTVNTTKDDAARLEAQNKIEEVMREQVQLQDQLNAAQGQNSFAYQFNQVITQLKNVAPLAQQVASAFQNVWTTATSSIVSNLTKVIAGTESWRKSMLDISRTVVTDLIQNFVKMAVSWVEQHLIMGVATKIFNELVSSESGASTLTVLGNLLKQITGYAGTAAGGAASAEASIPYVGPVLAVASAAAMFAEVMNFATGFSGGGYTGDGSIGDIAGVVHRGEYVMSAASVNRLGVGNLEALHNGTATATPGGLGGASGASGVNINHVVVNDRQELMNELKKPKYAKVIVTHIRNNRLAAGIKS